MKELSIATWNVNSVRTRLSHVLEFLREDQPDIVFLQEIKCLDEQFPRLEIEDAGYNLAIYGQKTYNGVAILSKFPLEDVTRGLPNFPEDSNARYIEAIVNIKPEIIRIASVYVPNGQETGSEKFAYKLRFLEHLYQHIASLRAHDEMLVIGGDYNIAPADSDAANPDDWKESVLTHDDVRRIFRQILNCGMYDAGAEQHQYTWWDYRAGAFAKNDGLRIDHMLLSPPAIDKLKSCKVITRLRELEKPSDHAPVMINLSF